MHPGGDVMTASNRADHSADRVGAHPRDEGSVLILVLAMIVISALIVVPTLTYATTVLKTNSVVVQKTKRQEAVKAGFAWRSLTRCVCTSTVERPQAEQSARRSSTESRSTTCRCRRRVI